MAGQKLRLKTPGRGTQEYDEQNPPSDETLDASYTWIINKVKGELASHIENIVAWGEAQRPHVGPEKRDTIKALYAQVEERSLEVEIKALEDEAMVKRRRLEEIRRGRP